MRAEAKHSIVVLAGTGITAGISLIYTVYAGRVLGRAEYGVFATAVTLVMMCQLAIGPINETLTRFSAQYVGEGCLGKIRTLSREVGKRLVPFGLGGLIVGMVLLKPLQALWQLESTTPLLVAYGMICLTLPLAIARGVLRGMQRFGQYNVNIISEAAIRLVVGLILLSLLWGATWGLTAYLVALAATLVLSRFQLSKAWRGHPAEPLDGRAVRRFTAAVFVMMITYAAFFHVDMLYVKHYFPDAEAGIYGAAFALARVLAMLVSPFNTVMLPLLTTMNTKGEPFSGTFIRICLYFLGLAAVPLGLFWLCPDKIMNLTYGEEFAAAGALLLGLGVARLVGFLCHLIALAGAATNTFGFLYIYVPGLVVEMITLALWHDSLSMVVGVVLIVQAGTFVFMAAFAAYRILGRRPVG